jgi:NAD(P)-dependent dehydrogenase (short-subunit alcohol dehydrogenase family)
MGDRLKGKVAVVTGAGSQGPGWGNGKATAVVFAREGAKVVAADLNQDAVDETKRLIESEGGECITVIADVARQGDVQAMMDECIRAFGRIDVLHNNVGIGSLGGPTEVGEEEWDRVFNVNVKSMYFTCRAALPIMERQGKGSIINISSIGSIRDIGVPYVAYGASKAAVNQLTQSIAVEYARKGIRCNAILPGLMNTPMVQKALQSLYANTDELVRTRDERCPTGKMGTGWDIAYSALFLASDEAAYVNGIQLVVDGGLTATIR